MIPYVMLLFFPLLFACVSNYPEKHRRPFRTFLAIGREKEIMQKSFMLPVFFIYFFLLLALRHQTLGRDLFIYRYYFNKNVDLSFGEILAEKDVLYELLSWSVSQFTDNFGVLLVIVAAICVFPIAKVYCEDREYGYLKMTLFVNMTTFIVLFSSLRQAIAFSLGLWAYTYVRKRKLIKFIIAAFIAIGFHHSAFMVFFLYPLYFLKIRKKHVLFIFPAILVVYLFNSRIFIVCLSWLTKLLGEDYEVKLSSTGAMTTLLLFVLFGLFSFIFPDENKMDEETFGLRNYLIFAIFIQCFAPVHTLAMRMNYYFILFIPILLPKVLKHTKNTLENVRPYAEYVLVGFFTLYYLYIVYRGSSTGISALDTFPYVPFWK